MARPFRSFAGRNLRTGPLLKRLLPWNWLRSSTAIEALAEGYYRRLTKLGLSELPTRPRFVYCATDMTFGVNWIFTTERLGDYLAGYASPSSEDARWTVARAVAASSCFPPLFDPLHAGVRPEELTGGRVPRSSERNRLVSGLRLTDGGVYDNMGLEPVWKTHRLVLVSDGGAAFGHEWDRGLLWRLWRYASIVGRQASALRKRWLISGFLTGEMQGTYWGIGSATAHYGPGPPAGYSSRLVQEIISRVRTDMDAFSEAECAVLENHGYLLAEAAVRRHLPSLVAGRAPLLNVPHPDWMDEEKVRRSLRQSHRRRLPFGRL